jgi:hypothetical protein
VAIMTVTNSDASLILKRSPRITNALVMHRPRPCMPSVVKVLDPALKLRNQ